jgi:hypothetical protein
MPGDATLAPSIMTPTYSPRERRTPKFTADAGDGRAFST